MRQTTQSGEVAAQSPRGRGIPQGCGHFVNRPHSAKKSWSQADEAMELMLQAECPAFNKMSTETMMSNLINVIKTYFSKPEPEQTKPRPSRPHEHEFKRLRLQLRDLRKTWRQRSTEPPGDTLELRQAFHATHRRLKRLTADSRSCRLTSKGQSNLGQFWAYPFRFGQRLFKPPNETKPDFDANTAYTHFVSCYTDDDRCSVFEQLDELPVCETPQTAFKGSPPTFSELTSVLKRKRNSSSPGPNGVPYIVWKMCPSLQKILLKIICRGWKKYTFSPAELSSERGEKEVLADSNQSTAPPSTKSHVSYCAACARRREKMAAEGTSSTTG